MSQKCVVTTDNVKYHVLYQCQKLTFLADSKYLLPGVKVGSKTNITGGKNWWPYYSPLAICTSSCKI